MQIRKIVRTAQVLARNEQEWLTIETVEGVIEITESFERDLQGSEASGGYARVYLNSCIPRAFDREMRLARCESLLCMENTLCFVQIAAQQISYTLTIPAATLHGRRMQLFLSLILRGHLVPSPSILDSFYRSPQRFVRHSLRHSTILRPLYKIPSPLIPPSRQRLA